MKYKGVRVTWLDSATLESWTPIENVPHTQFKKIETLGWLIRKSKDMLVVAPHVGRRPDQVCDVMFIPTCSIILIEDVDVKAI